MGTWGPGLYTSDLAKDLKATITSVIRLPFEPNELVRLLKETFHDQSGQPGDEEYTTFWLVVADQFHKCGINEPSLFERAIKIVDTEMDVESPGRKELSPFDCRKRDDLLAELRSRLTQPVESKKRKTVSKPQPLILNAGDLIVYPVFEYGQCVNPYSSKWKQAQKAWGAAYIVKSGHVFQYLAYYVPVVLTLRFELSRKPSTTDLLSIGKLKRDDLSLLTARLEPDLEQAGKWELKRPGTCSTLYFQRMQLEVIEQLPIDDTKLADHFPAMRDGRYQAVNDISISNSLGASPESDGTLDYLEQILK